MEKIFKIAHRFYLENRYSAKAPLLVCDMPDQLACHHNFRPYFGREM
jgi:hypothetical protein